MFGTRLIRTLHRHFSTAVVWAMVPLAVLGGVPTVSCACVNCHCEAACGSNMHGAAKSCLDSGSSRQAGCCSCCCGHCSGGPGCCCQGKNVAHHAPPAAHQAGTGFEAQHNGCRTSVSVVTAIQTTKVVVSDHQPLTADVLTLNFPTRPIWSLDRTGEFNTGPPVDLVVTLQRLVI
jgi:hypothetical protein